MTGLVNECAKCLAGDIEHSRTVECVYTHTPYKNCGVECCIDDPWINPKTGNRYPRCDGCHQPITSQAEHDQICGWSVIKARRR